MVSVAVAEQLDAGWKRKVLQDWKAEHARVQAERAQLQALEERSDSLDPDERLTLAQLTGHHRSLEETLARYREILDGRPDDPLARYSVGRILLELDNDAGLAELDRAMELDPAPSCLHVSSRSPISPSADEKPRARRIANAATGGTSDLLRRLRSASL